MGKEKQNTSNLAESYCIVVDTDGYSKLHRLEKGEKVFEKAKSLIGCQWLDHVIIERGEEGICLECLVNDNGYADWGNDPTKINQVVTALYNNGESDPHYILGNAVFCLSIDGEDGGEFVGMGERLATKIAMTNNEVLAEKAKKFYPRPNVVPNPEVKIYSYDSAADMLEALKSEDYKTKATTEETIG